MANKITDKELERRINKLGICLFVSLFLGILAAAIESRIFNARDSIILITIFIFAGIVLVIGFFAFKDIFISLARIKGAEKTVIIELFLMAVLVFSSIISVWDFFNSGGWSVFSASLVSIITLWQTWLQFASEDWDTYAKEIWKKKDKK